MPQILGLLLFLFIPFTLFLLVYAPISLGVSLVAAVATIVIHRPVARRYLLRYIHRRCLWCGRTVGPSAEPIRAGDRRGPLAFRGCTPRCRDRALAFVGTVDRFQALLVLGIGVPLTVHVLSGGLIALGADALDGRWRLILFRGVIALTVLSAVMLFWTRRSSIPTAPPRFPFPIHNIFLLGIRNTMGVFVVVGVLWLVQTARLAASGAI